MVDLKFGFIWVICSVKGCEALLDLKTGKVEDDGKYSHSYCEPHFADAMREVLGDGR